LVGAHGRRGCGGHGDHLRAAVLALDELIGAVTPEDVLDRVFAAFCVGK